MDPSVTIAALCVRYMMRAVLFAVLGLGASIAFAQNPVAPTPPAGDNSTRIANTEWVHGEIGALAVVTPYDFCSSNSGGKCYGDTQRQQCTISTSGHTLTINSGSCSFSAATDVGKSIVVGGSGAIVSPAPDAQPYASTITAVASPSSVTVGGSGFTQTLTSSSQLVSWGHLDTGAIQAMLYAATTSDPSTSSSPSTSQSICAYLPQAPNGMWGIGSPLLFDQTAAATPGITCFHGPGRYSNPIVAMAPMAQMIQSSPSFDFQGEIQGLNFDGNAITSAHVAYFGCAERMYLSDDRFANGGFQNATPNDVLNVGAGTSLQCSSAHLNNVFIENNVAFYGGSSDLPYYGLLMGTSDGRVFGLEIQQGGYESSLYNPNSSFETSYSHVNVWAENGYAAQNAYDLHGWVNLDGYILIGGAAACGVYIHSDNVHIANFWFSAGEAGQANAYGFCLNSGYQNLTIQNGIFPASPTWLGQFSGTPGANPQINHNENMTCAQPATCRVVAIGSNATGWNESNNTGNETSLAVAPFPIMGPQDTLEVQALYTFTGTATDVKVPKIRISSEALGPCTPQTTCTTGSLVFNPQMDTSSLVTIDQTIYVHNANATNAQVMQNSAATAPTSSLAPTTISVDTSAGGYVNFNCQLPNGGSDECFLEDYSVKVIPGH